MQPEILHAKSSVSDGEGSEELIVILSTPGVVADDVMGDDKIRGDDGTTCGAGVVGGTSPVGFSMLGG